MFSAIVAVMFAGAAVFAVMTIARSFEGGAEKIDALFARYRAMDNERPVFAKMKPVVRFTPAPAPQYAPRKVIALPRRSSVAFQFRAGEWRAAA